jgi:hypothetical protein
VGHSDLVEEHVSVVHRGIAIFRAYFQLGDWRTEYHFKIFTYVTDRDALQRFVGAHVADLDDERVGSVVDELFGVL